MKNFSFLALIATVLCLVACGPKETKTPLSGTSDYMLYSMSDTPEKFGVKRADGLTIIPNVYTHISYEQELFVARLNNKYLLLTPENKIFMTSSDKISYNAKINCFETKDKGKITLFFPKERGKISGDFEKYELDANNNLLIKSNGKYGVFSPLGQIIIPIENEILLMNMDNYIALNSKNTKQPMLNDKGKITNWSRVKITAFDREGKKIKAPSLAQVKKMIQ